MIDSTLPDNQIKQFSWQSKSHFDVYVFILLTHHYKIKFMSVWAVSLWQGSTFLCHIVAVFASVITINCQGFFFLHVL